MNRFSRRRAATEKHGNIKFLIVGDGIVKSETEKLAADLKIDKDVIFAGYIENVNDIVNIMDICTLTSEREALSISLIEGMSIGKPAVAINGGGPGEVIEDGKNGILINSLDHTAFPETLSFYNVKLVSNKEKRRQMGEWGKKIASEKFGADQMAQRLQQIYISLAKRSNKNG